MQHRSFRKAVMLLLTASLLLLCGCQKVFVPLTAEEPATLIEREDLLNNQLENYSYYDVNRHELRWYMSEDEVKRLFQNDELMSEDEGSDSVGPYKSLSYKLDLLTYYSDITDQNESPKYHISLYFDEIDSTYQLTQVNYSYSAFVSSQQNWRNEYRFVKNDLMNQYGEPHYQLETDFTDIEPHYVYRTCVLYETNRWHVGHDYVELNLEVREMGYEEIEYQLVISERYAPFYTTTDITYDFISKDSTAWVNLIQPTESTDPTDLTEAS